MKKTGKNLTDLLDLNRAQIMHYLAHHPGCSRAELGKATGLTLASITKIIRSLLENSVVYETGSSEGKKGRRSIGLSISYDKYKVLAVKLSWQRLRVCAYDLQGKVHGEEISVPFESITPDNIQKVMGLLTDSIRHFQAEFPDIIAIGMAVPGPYYRDAGALLLPPYTKIPENRIYYPLEEELLKNISLPVFIEHDADAGALGYWWFYTNCDRKQVILNIIAGDGIGGGVVEDGNIFSRSRGCSCELGHISIKYDGRKCNCGSRGCLDAYSSFRSVRNIAQEYLPDYPDSLLNRAPSFSAQTFFEAAKKGDTLTKKLIKEAGNYLGYGIASLLPVFNPDIVVVSDIMAMGNDILLLGIKEGMEDRYSSFGQMPEIRLFDPSQDLILLGAASLAIDHVLSEPTKYLISINERDYEKKSVKVN